MLKIAGRCRLNILISGGTGSGKTTLLNALSRMIDHGERIVTIEDAAELQLQQPHVVRLETRPPNLEGTGEVTQRDLVKNALRMRPDRIILGEIRGGEALDMLQAMNTGHDGSLGTIHANRPREALTRLENMVAMTGIKLPHEAVRAQIAGALNMIVQVSRMRDGVRRITHISEVVGMEGDVITMQDLFTFEYKGEDPGGRLFGSFKCSGLRPHFATQAEYFALDRPLLEAITRATEAIAVSAAIAVAVGGATFVATAAVAFAGTGGARARLRQRARTLAQRQKNGGSARVPGKPAATSLKKAEARSVPFFENLARRFLPRQSALRDRLARTGSNLTIGTYLMICGGLVPIVFAAALGFGLTAPPRGPGCPRRRPRLAAYRRRRRRRTLPRQVPRATSGGDRSHGARPEVGPAGHRIDRDGRARDAAAAGDRIPARHRRRPLRARARGGPLGSGAIDSTFPNSTSS